MLPHILPKHLQIDPLAVDVLALNCPAHPSPKGKVRQVDYFQKIALRNSL